MHYRHCSLFRRPTLVHPVVQPQQQHAQEQHEPVPAPGPSSTQARDTVQSISSTEDLQAHSGTADPNPSVTQVVFPEPPVVPKHALPPIEHPPPDSTEAWS